MNEHYLHFPGQRVASLDDLDRLGYGGYLDRNADGADISVTFFDGIAAGPRGEIGSLAVLSAPDGIPPSKPVHVDESNQHWVLLAEESQTNASPAWIGYRRDFPPTPESLRRRMLLVRTKAKLGGEDWQLPAMLRLPLAGIDTTGALVDAPVTEADILAHRLACELAVGLQSADIPRDNDNYCPIGARSLVEHALRRNYRGDWGLWEKLGLFDCPPVNIAVAVLHATGIVAVIESNQ
jgi:hypothetical protein